MQTQVCKIADTTCSPYFAIVEAPMGQGKTEAALYAIDKAMQEKIACGFYIALPTQATSNAMMDRVTQGYLAERSKTVPGRFNVQLVHGGSLLSAAFEHMRMASLGDDPDEVVVAEEWFCGHKRSLLAPYGVGTIDQTLMGTLQARHWFIRLFGLAGKTVVFDEVHAYDVYTTSLLARLLSWLRGLGCTVILLSATLPEEKRMELLSAWGQTTVIPQSVSYPRITVFRESGVEAIPFEPPVMKHPVEVKLTPTDPLKLAEKLATDVPLAGCAAIICNTVKSAIQMFRTLRHILERQGWEIELFHARTLASWRQEKETDVLAHYGKKSDQRGKRLLIATQVIEQSLDLDFDWMATELAPVDLVLQRMGRLWRHEWRCRPLKIPVLYVLCDIDHSGFPLLSAGQARVYEPYILTKTFLAFQSVQSIEQAQDIENLIAEVYSKEIAESDPKWRRLLTDQKLSMDRNRNEQEKMAESVMLPNPCKGAKGILERGVTLDDTIIDLCDGEDPSVHSDVRAATRLGDPGVTVVCTGTLSDGNVLSDASGRSPDIEEIRRLIGQSVAVSNRGIREEILKHKSPAYWKNSALLRYARLMVFNNGIAELGRYTLYLGKEEGLVIERIEKGEERGA